MIFSQKKPIAFFITLMLFGIFSGRGQTRPVAGKDRFGPTDSVLTVRFSTKSIPDSTILAGVHGICKLKDPKRRVYFTLTNSGAILAYSDSSLMIPIRLEKQSYFPFHQLKANQRYEFKVSGKIGKDGFLVCRLKSGSSEKILDEVFICTPWMDDVVQSVSLFPSTWIKEEK